MGLMLTLVSIPCGEVSIRLDFQGLRGDKKRFLKATIRGIYAYAEIRNEFVKMFQHMDRHLNEVSFIKCGNPECCDPFTSTLFEEFIKASDKKLKAPTLSSEKDGHYKTFLEECINANPRFGQPSAQGNDLSRCTVCPNYSFTSKTEKMRHSI